MEGIAEVGGQVGLVGAVGIVSIIGSSPRYDAFRSIASNHFDMQG